MAFAANPVNGIVNPLTWALALWPYSFAFDLYNIFNIFLAGFGTAALSRRLGAGPAGSAVAGITLATGGYLSSVIVNGMPPCLAWVPWVAWAADRVAVPQQVPTVERIVPTRLQAGALFAAISALQISAGEPAALLIAAALALNIVIARAPRKTEALVIIVVSALVAIPLAAMAVWPGLYVFADSARAAGLDRGGLDWSLHPARMLEFVWPLAYGTQRGDGWFAGLLLARQPGDPFWAFNLYVGFPVLLLAGAAARVGAARRLLGGSVLLLVLAFGSFTPVYGLLIRIVPLHHLINFPEKYVYGALIIWSALAGVGFSHAMNSVPKRWLLIVAASGTILLAIAVIVLQFETPALTSLLTKRAAAWHARLDISAGLTAARFGGHVAVVAAFLFVFALWLRRSHPASHAATALAAFAIVAPHVLTNWDSMPLAGRPLLDQPPSVLQSVSAVAGSAARLRPRIFRYWPTRPTGPFADGKAMAIEIHETLDTNVAARFGFNALPGFETGESFRFRQFWLSVFPRMTPQAFLRLLGIDYVMAQNAEGLNIPIWLVSQSGNGWSLLAVQGVRPRAFVAARWVSVATDNDALGTLAIPGRDADAGTVVLVGAGAMPDRRPGALTPCRTHTKRPEEIEIDCESTTGGYVVLLEEARRGWTATLDGIETPILLADGLFRAVAIPAGRHQITFHYRTPGLRAGALVSVVSWCGLGVLYVGIRKRHTQAAQAQPI